MSKLTFRNSQGQFVDISTVAATKAKNEFGDILEKIVHGGIERGDCSMRPCQEIDLFNESNFSNGAIICNQNNLPSDKVDSIDQRRPFLLKF